MVFIWRGAGIMVPIVLFICCWICSYSFEDTRLGNPDYMGWSMIWAGIPLFIIGGLVAASNLPDAETGEKPEKSYNDFFFIPIWIWGLFFLGFGIYL